MKRRLALRSAVVLGAVFCWAGWTVEGQSNYSIRSDVRLVLLDVSVRDRAGRLVSGLSKDNFRIYENGRLQQITAFDGEDVPVTVGILVDESFSMRNKRSEVLAAAQTFIEESNSQDEVFVLNFNDRAFCEK
jgi:Ca-activated chloride channel homolog